MEVVLLLVGYVVAVPLVVRLRGTLRERRLGELLLLEAATALVALGWGLGGAPVGVVLNVLFVVGFAVAWYGYRPGLASRSSNRPAGRSDR